MYQPTGVSPRFTCDYNQFDNIQNSLDTVGHVVLEQLFDTQPLAEIQRYSMDLFENIDQNSPDLRTTTSSFTAEPKGRSYQNLLIEMISRSQIIDLFSYLYKSDHITAILDPLLRRVSSSSPLNHIDLHTDMQTHTLPKSQQAFTLWIPLVDIDPHTPGLMLFDSRYKLTHEHIDQSTLEALDDIYLYDKKDHSLKINLTSAYIASKLHSGNLVSREDQYQQCMSNLVKQIGKHIYTPLLTTSSAILFRDDIIHSSYCHQKHNNIRYSIDLRFIDDFYLLAKRNHRIKAWTFKKYWVEEIDPITGASRASADIVNIHERIDEIYEYLKLRNQLKLGFKKMLSLPKNIFNLSKRKTP